MDNLHRIRQIMQWVSKCELQERKLTLARIADDLDLPQSSVNRLVTRLYPECFNNEPWVGVTLTGKWPNDIAFDWETLKPLENIDPATKFRPPNSSPSNPKTTKRDWNTADEYLFTTNNFFVFSVEDLVDGIQAELYPAILNGLSALVELLEKRGPLPKDGFFHQVTGLHYERKGGIK